MKEGDSPLSCLRRDLALKKRRVDRQAMKEAVDRYVNCRLEYDGMEGKVFLSPYMTAVLGIKESP